jgi:hypothetical protein
MPASARRHRLDRFALAVQQEAAHVYRAPVLPLPSPQRLHQVGQELFQALSTFLEVALGHGPELSISLARGQQVNVVVLDSSEKTGTKSPYLDNPKRCVRLFVV